MRFIVAGGGEIAGQYVWDKFNIKDLHKSDDFPPLSLVSKEWHGRTDNIGLFYNLWTSWLLNKDFQY